MTVRYTTINGRIIKENRDGVKRGYVHDPQGNTVALVDEDGQITDTWEYSAFGEVESHTGSSPTPFTWNGARGYYTDPTGLTYVRARYYNAPNGQWQTMDPLWPHESSYLYANSNPTSLSDPSGRQVPSVWREWADKVFPPGEGIPNWIIPDEDQKCISDWWAGERLIQSFQFGFGGPCPMWNYGNCCGLSKKCGPGDKALTCADEACKAHDVCLGATLSTVVASWTSCNKAFCNDLKYCWNTLCAGRFLYDKRQCQAIYEMAWAHCPGVGLSGPPGGYPPPRW